MKNGYKWLLMVILILMNVDLHAQHCPFDGSYAIAIRIKQTGKGGRLPDFFLAEKEVSRKDTCRFNDRVDSTRFLSEKEVKAEMAEDPRSTRSRYLPERLKKDFNFLKGNRVVFLSMSQKDCMVERGNEYDLLPRHLVVRYSYDGRETEIVAPPESIYSLCGAGGSWKRIKPMEIQLP